MRKLWIVYSPYISVEQSSFDPCFSRFTFRDLEEWREVAGLVLVEVTI